MQKCLGFRLGFETGSIDPAVRPLSHSDSLFEAFKVDVSQYTKHTKPRPIKEFEHEGEEVDADPPS